METIENKKQDSPKKDISYWIGTFLIVLGLICLILMVIIEAINFFGGNVYKTFEFDVIRFQIRLYMTLNLGFGAIIRKMKNL